MSDRILEDLRAALMLFTRLPVRAAHEAAPDLSRSVWAYPVVGAVVGLIGAALFGLAMFFGLPAAIAAVLAIAAMVLATGAFHEDGLADTADGFGGGATAERKLAIMRDSRIGTYGAIAIAISLLIRITALASLPSALTAATALVTLGALSRGAIVVLLATLPPARPDGMGAVAARPERPVVLAGSLLALLPLVFWPLPEAGFILIAAAVATAIVWWLSRKQVGGYTGDVLGAGQQVSECACWIVVAALFN